MQQVSELYRSLIADDNHWFEYALAIGESGRLITERGDTLLFGGTAILVDSGGAETGYRNDVLYSMETYNRVFSEDYPTVGMAVAGEIDIRMKKPIAVIPKRARLAPFVRVTNGAYFSEWLQRGVYFIDSREVTKNDDGLDILSIHGYDAIVFLDQDYPSDSTNNYPMLDVNMVKVIADSIKVQIDPRTITLMNKGYTYGLPAGYSSREVLGFIAASYGGNFVMSDEGMLLLVTLGSLPKETNYLITQLGDRIVFGEDRILV